MHPALSQFPAVRRIATHLGFGKPVGFHSRWTRRLDGLIGIDQPEQLTMVYGAYKYRKVVGAPFYMHCDAKTELLLRRKDLHTIYDGIIVEETDPRIDAELFWAANKITAYKHFPAPCISLDTDAVLLRPIHRTSAGLCVLHTEPLTWQGYKDNLSHFESFLDGPYYGPSCWEARPFNCGVVGFFDEDFRERYVSEVEGFMLRYSASKQQPVMTLPYGTGSRPYSEMIFSEQRLMAMLACQLGTKVEALTNYQPGSSGARDHAAPNDYAFHLWNSKDAYQGSAPARSAFIFAMTKALLEEFPETEGLLRCLGFRTQLVSDANWPSAQRFVFPSETPLPGENPDQT